MSTSPDPSRTIYDFYSGAYDRVFGRVFQRSREAVIRNLVLGTRQRVLEVGVGTGLCLPLYPSGAVVTGIDLSEKMLRLAQERTRAERLEGVRLLVMDAGRMSFQDDCFDTVIAAYVVTAVTDYERLINEMVRVTRPGGTIIILNHFLQESRIFSAIERAISPLCRRIGFRTDLSVNDIIGQWPMRVLREDRMPPLGMWRVLVCENEKALAPDLPLSDDEMSTRSSLVSEQHRRGS